MSHTTVSGTTPGYELNSILPGTTVEVIANVKGINHRRSPLHDDIAGVLFFYKLSDNIILNAFANPSVRLAVEVRGLTGSNEPQSCAKYGPSQTVCSDERIPGSHCVGHYLEPFSRNAHQYRFIKESIPSAQRAILLVLLSLCIRLQNEPYAYMETFMERHLSLRNTLTSPLHSQTMSPPQMNSVICAFYCLCLLADRLSLNKRFSSEWCYLSI
jgi:hypothetical protein